MLRFALASMAAGVFVFAPQLLAKPDANSPLSGAARPLESGEIRLEAPGAEISGPNARLEGTPAKSILWWTYRDTSIHWKAHVPKAGNYRVRLDYAIIGNNNGSKLEILIGDQALQATPKVGVGLNDYRVGEAGVVTIAHPGTIGIWLKPLVTSREFVISIRSLSLIPAENSTQAIDVSGNPIAQAEDGSFMLWAKDAEINGSNAQLETTHNPPNIGFWRDLDTTISWKIKVQTPGKYRAELDYSLSPNCVGTKVALQVGDEFLKARPIPTRNWADYNQGRMGELQLDQPGELQVVLSGISRHHDYILNLRSLCLIPSDKPTKAIDIADQPVKQSTDGSLVLSATNAEIDGLIARLEGGDKKHIVWWGSPEGRIKWPIQIDKPGAFRVQFTYSLGQEQSMYLIQLNDEKTVAALSNTPRESSGVEIRVGDQVANVSLSGGKSLDNFQTVDVGSIKVDKAGISDLVLKSSKEAGGLVMYLRSVSLVPEKQSPEKNKWAGEQQETQ